MDAHSLTLIACAWRYCVTCRLLKAAQTEWGPLPGQAVGTQQIIPQILYALLRDTFFSLKRQNVEEKSAEKEKSAENLRKNLRQNLHIAHENLRKNLHT